MTYNYDLSTVTLLYTLYNDIQWLLLLEALIVRARETNAHVDHKEGYRKNLVFRYPYFPETFYAECVTWWNHFIIFVLVQIT